MGFRVPKRYMGMLHFCSLERCVMSRQLKRWCKFGSGSLDKALSRISACIMSTLPPKGMSFTLSQETRDLLWGGLPSSMRRNSWFILSGADRVKCESKRTYVVFEREAQESLPPSFTYSFILHLLIALTRVTKIQLRSHSPNS